MGTNQTIQSDSIFEWPTNPIGYVAILMALITGVIHLVATTRAIEMSVVLAVLFVLNGLGFLGGAILYLTRFWRRWLFLVAAMYSLVTILALFPFQGWGIEAFYMNGSINPVVVVTKVAEAVLAVVSVYLYASTDE
jgi:TM2 domain-containing membrane protein YozV